MDELAFITDWLRNAAKHRFIGGQTYTGTVKLNTGQILEARFIVSGGTLTTFRQTVASYLGLGESVAYLAGPAYYYGKQLGLPARVKKTLVALVGDKKPEKREVGFSRDIQPILKKCIRCHGPQKQAGRLRLDTPQGMAAGSQGRPVVVPYDAEVSQVVFVAEGGRTSTLRNTPEHEFPVAEVALLKRWINQGAPWPGNMNGIVKPGAGP